MINQLINSIIDCEKALEKIRIKANKQTLFCIKPILERFDQENKGYITTYDLISFCQDNNIECSLIEAFCCLKYLDVNKDGRVTLEDLATQMLTKTNHEIRFMAAMREPYYIEKQMCLPEIIEKVVVEYFQELISYIKIQLKQKVTQNEENFNYFNFLQKVDVSNSGVIKFADLQTYFKLTDEDCQYFFMQGNFDQKMEYQQFLDVLMVSGQNKLDKFQKANEEQPFQEQKERENMSPEGRKTVKMQKEQPKNFYNSEETFSNASSIFVDRIATDLQDLQLTPFKDTDKKDTLDQNIKQTRQNYNLFLQMLLKCRQILKVQEKLLQRYDFCCKQLFEQIDINKQGYVTEQDFQNGFRRMKFQVTGYTKYLIKNYGKNDKLNFNEFVLLFLPENYKYEVKDKSTPFSSVTIDYIRQLFQDLIDMEKFKLTQIWYQLPDLTSERQNLENQITALFTKYQTYPRPEELKLIPYYLSFSEKN